MKNEGRMLVIGSDYSTSIERLYVKHLLSSGCDVQLIGLHNTFMDYYSSSLLNKVLFRSGFSKIYNKLNNILVEKVNAYEPDCVWVFKGMEIKVASLKAIKEKGVTLINYNPDNPFIFSGPGSGNKNISDSVSVYDFHFTYNHSVKERIERDYNIKTAILPFGFEIEDILYKSLLTEKEVVKACFLGNPDKERALFIRRLADEGIQLDLYGHFWNRFISHPNVSISPPVYGDEFWRTLRKYRVQLNLMRPHNLDSHNMRSFEIPGVGGIMLAPDTTEHRMYFQEGRNVFLFSDVGSCVNQVKNLLKLPKYEAEKIRDEARLFSVKSGYTYKDRAGQALKAIQSITRVSR
jgi:spore maturation protein CgeB